MTTPSISRPNVPAASFDLRGRVAVVTGGSQGAGWGIAAGLAEAGAAIMLASRNAEAGLGAVEALRALGAQAGYVQADVTLPPDAERIAGAAVTHFDRLDILVNCSGIVVRGPALDMPEAEWDAVMNTNLRGAWLCARAAARHMANRGGGRVINVASLNAVRPGTNKFAYGVSKAGLVQLTRALAVEWAPYHINVNAIAPGMIVSSRLEAHFAKNPLAYQSAIERIPLGRPGLPADLAGVSVFLAADASAYITGQVLFVDGGSSLT